LVLFYGGCRPIEVTNLKWKDIDFDTDGAYIKIFSKKNNKEFTKFVPDNVSFYLKNIMQNNSEYVFPSISDKNKPMSHKTSYFRITRLTQKVLGKRINPYILRHSIASILYNKKGLDKDNVAVQMGHSKSMEEKYNHKTLKQLRDRARSNWIETEDLPPEKKHELELKIEEQGKQLKELARQSAVSGRYMQLNVQLQEKRITLEEYKKEMLKLADLSSKLLDIKQ